MRSSLKIRFHLLTLCLVWFGSACSGSAVTITVTNTRPLPIINKLVPPSTACTVGETILGTYIPPIPSGATIVSSTLSGYVDDGLQISGVPPLNIGLSDCAPNGFTDEDITSRVGSDGSFSYGVSDKTDDGGPVNVLYFEADNTVVYTVTDPDPQQSSPTNINSELCTYVTDCDGNVVQILCPERVVGCGTCGSEGSPRPLFNLATFGIKIQDTPVWENTAVGPELRVEMLFNNTGSTNPAGSFGPKWTCNWNSSVEELNAGTNRMLFPSGGLVTFVKDGNDVYQAPVSLEGELTFTNNQYVYKRPNGWTWEYTQSVNRTEFYLLQRIVDVWSNQVAVSYSNDLIHRVTQIQPDTGNYLEFQYGATNRIETIVTSSNALRTASFAYDSNGFLTNVLDAAAHEYNYVYTNGYIEEIWNGSIGSVQRLGVTYSATPDTWTSTNSHSVVLEDDGGFVKTYLWEYGAVSETISRGGADTIERFYQVASSESRGSVLGDVFSQNGQASYQYGPTGRITNRTDRVGGVWQQSYNAQNQLSTLIDPISNEFSYVYAANGLDLLHIVPPEGPIQEAFTYVTDRHAIASISNALGQVTTLEYNDLGLITNIYDGRAEFSLTYNSEGHLTAWFRESDLMQTNSYDAFGRLQTSENAAGLDITLTYDELDRITSATLDNNGQLSTISNEYDCCNLSKTIDRNGNVTLFTFNDIGELQSFVNPAGLTNEFVYGLEGQPTVISNPLEYSEREYNEEGFLTRVERPARSFDSDHAQNYFYDEENRLIKFQNFAGELYRFDVDLMGRRTASFVPEGIPLAIGVEEYIQAESNQYDRLNRLVQSSDIRGLVISNSYNALGQLTQRTYPEILNKTEGWTYNLWGDVTSFQNRLGQVVSNRYDSLGRLIEQIDGRSNSVHFGYSDADFLTTVSNESLNLVWTLTYDAEGRTTQINFPDGIDETRAYDPLGNVTQRVRAGITSTFGYDELSALTAVYIEGTLIESNQIDGLGRLVYTRNADGLVVTNQYDSWGFLNSRHWPNNLSDSFEYNGTRLDKLTDRLGIDNIFDRDTIGRLTQFTDGATNTIGFSYITNGINQISVLEDGEANKTYWEWNDYGQPTNKTIHVTKTHRWAYDPIRRLSTRTDNGVWNRNFVYDANHNLTELEVDFAGQNRLGPYDYQYDALNRRTNMTDDVGDTAWTYDSHTRLTSETGPFTTDPVNLDYDDLGRITNISYRGYTWAYAYDDLGRITDLEAPSGDYSFEYLEAGFRKTYITYPNGAESRFTHDSLIRVTNVTHSANPSAGLSIDYGYDAGDRRTTETWDTGRQMVYGYDQANRLLSVTSTSRPSDNLIYEYDRVGNITRRTVLGLTANPIYNFHNKDSGFLYTGTVTVVGQVNYAAGTVTVNGVTGEIYPGDLSFNATNISVVAGTNTFTAIYHGPAFTNASPTIATSIVISTKAAFASKAYDSRGNFTSDALRGYQYNELNQLTNAWKAPSVTNKLLLASYDGLGRRVDVTRLGTNIERYVYIPGTFLVLAVLDGTNGVKEVYDHGPDLSGTLGPARHRAAGSGAGGAGGIGGILGVTEIASSTSHFLHGDVQGNIILATDDDGNREATYQYAPYGKLIGQTGTYRSRYLFSSKEYDAETGFIYFGYRYLDTSTGRWTSRDNSELADGPNLYAYARNNPLNRIDPDGRDSVNNRLIAFNPELGIDLEFQLIGANVRQPVIGDFELGIQTGLATLEFTDIGDVFALTGFTLSGEEVNPFIAASFLLIPNIVEKPIRSGLKACRKSISSASDLVSDNGNLIFRIVDDVELADIQDSGVFRLTSGQAEAKQFVGNIEDAQKLQKRFGEFFGGRQTIIKGRVPQSIIDNAIREPFSDIPNGIAITIKKGELPLVSPEL